MSNSYRSGSKNAILQEKLKMQDEERVRDALARGWATDVHWLVDALVVNNSPVLTRTRWVEPTGLRGRFSERAREDGYVCVDDAVDDADGRLVMWWLRCHDVNPDWALWAMEHYAYAWQRVLPSSGGGAL